MTDPSRLRGLKHALDILLSVAVLAASVAVIWQVVFRTASIPGAVVRKEFAPPKELQSLDGADLEGRQNSAAVLVIFSDFRCPFCATFAREVLPDIRETYVKPGRLAIGFRHYPLQQIHPDAFKLAAAAECAARQGRFWPTHDLFFSIRPPNLADLDSLISAIQVEADPFRTCIASEGADGVRADIAAAEKIGIAATPFFLLGVQESGGLRVRDGFSGLRSAPEFRKAIDALLEAR